jgi:hypothetical protein
MSLLEKAFGKVIMPSAADYALTKASVLDTAPAKAPPKAMMWDPLSLVYSLGYKDRRSNVTYDTLRLISNQLGVIAAIINTRVNQVATFSTPYRRTRNIGYEIKHKDKEHKLTDGEKKFILELELFIANCGSPKKNKYVSRRRDDFELFTRKVIRDRMIFDQLCFEVVPDRRGLPFEFVAVDASTMRIAAAIDSKSMKYFDKHRSSGEEKFLQEYGSANLVQFPSILTDKLGNAAYCQIWNGAIVRAFSESELAFCISNPRTDIRVNGYGLSELEQLVNIITSQLWAEEYNRNFFKQGAAPKGLLNIRGDNIAPEQLEAFRREWIANVSGAANAWRTPILQSEEVQYLNMQGSNLDMEFSRWLEYLIKVICACYLIAPEEIGFYLTPGGMQQPMFDSNNEWKLKASKDRGLRPILRFYASSLNKNILDKIDDHFYLDFVGLDELTERERIELHQSQVQFFRTINEVRKDEDLAPIDDGDIVMNPVYLQKLQMEHAWKVEAQTLKDQKKMQDDQMKIQKEQHKQGMVAQKQQMVSQKKQEKQQEKQVKQQEEAQKQQMDMQQQQVAMQQQQLGGAPPEGAPPEGAPPEGAPPEGAPPEGGGMPSEEELAAVAQKMGATPEEVKGAAKETGMPAEAAEKIEEQVEAPEGEAVAEEGTEEVETPEGEETTEEGEAVGEDVSPKELQEFINSLPPESFRRNVRPVEKSIGYTEEDDDE